MPRCEALVLMHSVTSSRAMYVPCGRVDADLHHKVTRARGGLILDQAGETYHHMYLCRHHHDIAHDQPAFENGLLIEGSVITGGDGRPLYTGPDEYLNEKYGRRDEVQRDAEADSA